MQKTGYRPLKNKVFGRSVGGVAAQDNAYFKAVRNYFNACYQFTRPYDKLIKAGAEDMGYLREKKYIESNQKNAKKVKKAIENLKKMAFDQVSRDMGTYMLKLNAHIFESFYSQKKNFDKAIADIEQAEKLIGQGLTMEEICAVREFSGAIKGIMGDCIGNIAVSPKREKTFADRLKKIQKHCENTLKTGFAGDQDKEAFFSDLAKEVKDLKEYIGAQNVYKSADDPVDTDGTKLNIEQISNANAFIGHIKSTLLNANGSLNRLERVFDNYTLQQKLSRDNRAKDISDFYNMMKDTKNGYLFHSNSKAYNDMMAAMEKVAVLSRKVDLNQLERTELKANYRMLEKVCTDYLTDRRLRSKTSTAGEDRVAGAISVLNILNPAKAREVAERAGRIRRSEVTIESMEAYARRRAAEREQARNSRRKAVSVSDLESRFSSTSGMKIRMSGKNIRSSSRNKSIDSNIITNDNDNIIHTSSF